MEIEERISYLKHVENMYLSEGDLYRAGLARGEANVLISLSWRDG